MEIISNKARVCSFLLRPATIRTFGAAGIPEKTQFPVMAVIVCMNPIIYTKPKVDNVCLSRSAFLPQ